MSFQVTPIRDLPHDDAKLLGHDQIVSNLQKFLENENMITPLSIAIHGDWVSGKTSMMRTLEKKLDKGKFEVVFFEAWKYEYSNPSIGLISELVEKYTTDGTIIRRVLTAALTVLSKQYLGFDPTQVVKMIRDSKAKTETISKQLHAIIKSSIGSRKLVIIIDDLDRCDVENTLQLLAVIKLFLDVENCICIAAVDFNRLKQAWRKKYLVNGQDASEDGSEYLDKIFQIRIGIPRPTPEQIEEYVKTLVVDMPDTVAELFSKTLPKNPRSIKRILNLVSFRTNLLDSHYKEFSAIYWTLLEEIISNDMLVRSYNVLEGQGISIGHFIKIGNEWATIKNYFDKFIGNDILPKHTEKLSQFFTISRKISEDYKIEKPDLDKDFKILYYATNEALK